MLRCTHGNEGAHMILLTTGQVADRCGVSRQTVNEWARLGRIEPHMTVGTGRLYTVDECERVRAGRVTA
jgi:excisionase family DNA binding protein